MVLDALEPFVNAAMGILERTVSARLVVLAFVPMEQRVLSFRLGRPRPLVMTTFATAPLLHWVLVLMIPLILVVSAKVLFIMNASMMQRTPTKIGSVLTMVVVSTALRVLSVAVTGAGKGLGVILITQIQRTLLGVSAL
jgi:hypothetical protein